MIGQDWRPIRPLSMIVGIVYSVARLLRCKTARLANSLPWLKRSRCPTVKSLNASNSQASGNSVPAPGRIHHAPSCLAVTFHVVGGDLV
jgi:hypothetical protein